MVVSNLYRCRRERQILMTVEYRAAPGRTNIDIEIADNGDGADLRLRQVEITQGGPQPDTPERRLLQAHAEAMRRPLSPRSANAPDPAEDLRRGAEQARP